MYRLLNLMTIGFVFAVGATADAVEGGIFERLATVLQAKPVVNRYSTDTMLTFHGRTAKAGRECSVAIVKRDRRTTYPSERGLIPDALWELTVRPAEGSACVFYYDSRWDDPSYNTGFSLIRGRSWELTDESFEFSRWDNFAGHKGKPGQEFEFILLRLTSPTKAEAFCDELPWGAYRSMKDGCVIELENSAR